MVFPVFTVCEGLLAWITFCNWRPVTGYLRNSMVDYVPVNGFLNKVPMT